MKTKNLIMALLIGLTLVLMGCSNQEFEQQIQQLQSQKDSLNQQNQDLQSQVDNLQNSLDNSQSELDDKTQELLDAHAKWEQERECLIEKSEVNLLPHSEDHIIVSFVEGTTETEAENIIESYGLSVRRLGSLFDINPWGTVYVPEGKEVEWACKLILQEKIDKTSFDIITGAT